MQNIKIDRPIFMIGMPRSGTTVIAEAISLHRDLGWFSNLQVHLPRSYWLALLSRITNVPVIGEYLLGKKNQGGGISSKIKEHLPHCDEAYPIWEQYLGEKFCRDYLINQTATVSEQKSIKSLIMNVLHWQGKKRFFSKLTGPPRMHYLKSIFEDAYFLHVVRDPRAVVSSLLQVTFWKNGGLDKPWWQNGLPDLYYQEWLEHKKSQVALAAVQWKWIIELTGQEKEFVAKERYIEVRYEDFVEDPHLVIENIFYRLGLQDSPATHQYIESMGKIYNMNHKYKSYLKSGDIEMIETITSTTARKAGYIFKVCEK